MRSKRRREKGDDNVVRVDDVVDVVVDDAGDKVTSVYSRGNKSPDKSATRRYFSL